jgi:hypothetical protein
MMMNGILIRQYQGSSASNPQKWLQSIGPIALGGSCDIGADNNGLQFLDGSTQFFVDDQKVVLVLLDFIKGDSQTPLDYVVFIQPPVLEALTENLKRGGHDENTTASGRRCRMLWAP